MTNLLDLIEASDFKIKFNSFQEWIFGQAKWACLSHRSLEGGTRVQQIIIGYFVAPISETIKLLSSGSLFAYNISRSKSIAIFFVPIIKCQHCIQCEK